MFCNVNYLQYIMGISNKSHGKKTDKETQSPVLKLFRDMIHKEKHDPEKTNLLKNKTAEKKKKRHYHKTVESSCSDRQDAPYRGNQELRSAEYDPTRTQSIPFQGEKRESWWFWGEPNTEKPASDDTCSCVSCALKKIINTDYACICCLVLLFTISVIVAFLLVYKSIPCLNDKSGSQQMDNDRPKRKIDGLSRLRWDHLGRKTSGSKSDTGFSRYGLPHSMDSASSFHDLTTLVDSDSDLFKILDDGVMGEIQSSDRLREFYKKLIQTDAQIRKLKKNNEFSLTNMDNIDDKYKTYPERAKRSLKILHKPLKLLHFRKNIKDKVYKNNKIINDKNKINTENNKNTEVTNVQNTANKDSKLKNLNASRNKRFDNITEPEGYIIENKKVLIQYKPKHRKSKCSHAPKDSKSHENQLKHPFYKNTQRLDELLDKFLDRNFPEIITDPFSLDMVFEKEKKCKHPKIVPDVKESQTEKFFIKDDKELTKSKEELKNNDDFKNIHNHFTKITKSETSTTARNEVFADLEFDVDKKREDTTTDSYGLLMSVSTMMYSGSNNIKRTTYPPLIDRVPNARRLLQTDADDDINEVMVDSSHDESDKEDRQKRMDDASLDDLHNKLKMNPANVLNPNWKGPMPLYPDELNSMIKQEPIIVNRVENPVHRYNSETNEEPIANKFENIEHRKDALESDENLMNGVEVSVNSRDSPSETDEFETDLNDMEYIEDYFRNKYDRLVELAQAYSDYGVLDGKKINEKKVDDKLKLEGPDHRIKLSLSGFKEGFKNSIFGRPKKGSQEAGTPSEGFRLEIQPTSATREDNPLEIYKALQKHIKVANYKKPTTQSDLVGSDLDLIYRPRSEDLTTKKFGFGNNGLIFSVGKGKRSLKSIELDNNASSEVHSEDDEIYSKQNISNVFDSIHMKEKIEVGNSLAEENNVSSSTKLISIDNFAENNTNDGNTNMKVAGDENPDMSVSNFFMLLANWFSALDGVDLSVNHSLVENSSSSSPNKTKPNELNNNKKEDIIYPAYDSDMIENIGHRSRVLFSIKDVNATVDHKDDKEGMVEVKRKDDLKINNITNSLPAPKNVSKENKTKSIVKRDADNSNLIFWNDLYDDEYGVLDNSENIIRDKHSVGNIDFMRRPNEWFREKVSKITDGFHKRAKSFRKEHKGDAVKSVKEKNEKEVKIENKSKNAVHKRNSRDVEDNGVHEAKKTNFAALTASMKKICCNAARDIAQANKVDVREVSKEGQAASTLMQQLVRLMGDLVDYQVKQRTCRRLPSDLQNFLEWLTSSSPDTDSSKYSSGYKTDEYAEIDFGKISDKSEDHTLNMASSSEREDRIDSRSDCLGTLQSVQALMQQYEDLADDDKSKMTGVKEYLENQMQFLQKQMSSVYDFNLYNTDALRYRRDITSELPKNKHKRRNRRFKQIINNFANKFGIKHTNDKIINNTNIASHEVNKLNDSKKEVTSTIKEKRNLRDIYYKAIADAKKLTTAKNHM